MANKRNGTLYVGVTSDLSKRIWQHKSEAFAGFSADHQVKMLVWYEIHETMESAISREKLVKKWHRKWKLQLIEKKNPYWTDLYGEI